MMDKNNPWKPVYDLAVRYVTLEKQKENLMEEELHDICNEQEQIAGEIVGNTVKFLYSIAGKMLNGGFQIRVKGELRRLSLKGIDTTIDDLISEGVIGIYKGLKNYNPEGCTISTFLGINAASMMFNNTLKSAHTIYFPRHKHNEMRNILGRSENASEIKENMIEEMDLNPESTDLMFAVYTNRLENLDGPVYSRKNNGEQGNNKYIDVYVSDKSDSSNQSMMSDRFELRKKLESMLPILRNDRQRDIIRKRFAIGHPRIETLQEIANFYGVTREYVRQEEQQALKRLRKRANNNGLREFI